MGDILLGSGTIAVQFMRARCFERTEVQNLHSNASGNAEISVPDSKGTFNLPFL